MLFRSLEKIVRSIALLIALLYLVIIGRLLGRSANISLEPNERYSHFFASSSEFANFMQINVFLALGILMLSLIVLIIAVLLAQPNRFAFASLSVVGLFLVVFLYWEDAFIKFFEMGRYNGFQFLESYFFGFIINSSLLFGVCFCFFLISVYYPKDRTTKS